MKKPGAVPGFSKLQRLHVERLQINRHDHVIVPTMP